MARTGSRAALQDRCFGHSMLDVRYVDVIAIETTAQCYSEHKHQCVRCRERILVTMKL